MNSGGIKVTLLHVSADILIITVCQPCSYSRLAVLSSAGARSFGSSARGDFNPANELKKLRQAQHSSSHLEIGELLRVRGPVKTSRQQREIMASTYCEWRGDT